MDEYQSTGEIVSKSHNWRRKYQVKVFMHSKSTEGETAAENAVAQPGDTVLDVSDLRCTFSVKRYAMYYPNQALITIYNLNAGTERSIILEGYRVTLDAGYETSGKDNNYGQIFDGTVLMCSRHKENGTDYVLQILAVDAGQFINEGFMSQTYAKGQTLRDVVNDIANKATNPIKNVWASPKLDEIQFSKGFAMHGAVKRTLCDFAKSINGTWFVDCGKLYVIAYSDSSDILPAGMKAVVVSEQTGVIGNPQQIGQGVTVKMLLNPQIMPYGLIHIQNSLITRQLVTIGSLSQGIGTSYALDPQGIYRVISAVFTGDTRGNGWYTEVTAVTQDGNIPENLTN